MRRQTFHFVCRKETSFLNSRAAQVKRLGGVEMWRCWMYVELAGQLRSEKRGEEWDRRYCMIIE